MIKINKKKHVFKKKILIKLFWIFLFIWIFFLSSQNIFAEYNCNITPIWHKIFTTLPNWDFWFVTIWWAISSKFTWIIPSNKTQIEMDSEKCPEIDNNWNSTFDSHCRFSWTWIVQFFKFKNLSNSNYTNWELNTCPYEVNNNLINSVITYDNLTQNDYQTKITKSNSNVAIIALLNNFVNIKHPLSYFDWENLLLFWWLRDDMYNTSWNKTYKNYEWNLLLNLNTSWISWYIYNSPKNKISDSYTTPAIEKNYIKSFDYSFNNKCEVSCVSYTTENLHLISKPNWSWCFNPSTIRCSSVASCSSLNFNLPWKDYWILTNTQCKNKIWLSQTIFRHQWNISKNWSGYLIIWWKKIQTQW